MSKEHSRQIGQGRYAQNIKELNAALFYLPLHSCLLLVFSKLKFREGPV